MSKRIRIGVTRPTGRYPHLATPSGEGEENAADNADKKDYPRGDLEGGVCTPSIEGYNIHPTRSYRSNSEAGLEKVWRAVEALNKAEKKELYDRLALAIQAEIGSGRDLDMWATAVYAALAEAIGAGGAGMPGPLAVKRILAVSASWGPIESFSAFVGLAELKVAERQSAYNLLAKLLVARCAEVARAVRAPLTAKMVANSTADIAAIFDASFPGYARSGVALFVFRRHAHGE